MRIRLVRVVLLGFLIACSGGGDAPTQPISPAQPTTPAKSGLQSVVVVLPLASLAAGSSQVATATGKNSNDSTVVPGNPTWVSTNTSIAVISANGNVIAIAPGTDTIVATVGAVRGQAELTVTEALPLAAGVIAIKVAPGAVQSFALDGSATGYQIPVMGNASNYVFIVADADTLALKTKSFGIAMDSGSVIASSTPTTPLVSPGLNVPTYNPVSRVVQLGSPSDLETRIRNYERYNLPRTAEASMLVRKSLNAPRASATHNYSAGDVVSMNVTSLTGDLCNNYATIGARVLAVSTKAIVLMDTTVAVDASATTAATQLAQEFDNIVYPTEAKYFGTPSDIDGNGKVMMVLTPEVNKRTPKGSVAYFGGFFFAADLGPTSVCKASNAGEVFYLLAPDPQGRFGVPHTASDIEQESRGTVAHEFQHMINAGNRSATSTGFTGFEVSWMDEGLAHLAEDLVGRSVYNMSGMDRATRSNVLSNRDNYMAFFSPNVSRYDDYLRSVGTAGATGDAVSSLSVRGAAWSLLRSTADVYSGADVSAFTQKLANSKLTGVRNIVAASGVNFPTMIGSWAVANAYSLLGTNGTLSYASYDFADLLRPPGSTAPALIPRLSAGIHTNSTVVSADARYFQVSTTGASTPQTVHVVAAAGAGAAVMPTARLYVLRVQ